MKKVQNYIQTFHILFVLVTQCIVIEKVCMNSLTFILTLRLTIVFLKLLHCCGGIFLIIFYQQHVLDKSL